MTKHTFHSFFISILLLCTATSLAAADWFLVKKIEIRGADHIDVGAVYNSIPVKTGEILDYKKTGDIIRAVYKTGFFKNVSLARDGDTLVVKVVERSAIGKLTITGNHDIKKEELDKALKAVGLAEGWTYNPSMLAGVKQALERQYHAQGKYNAKITTTVKPLPRNRVVVAIDIKEGKATKIESIEIIGNKTYSDATLLKQFNLQKHHWYSFFTRNDIYSKEKLEADLEALTSYYLDRGFLRFKIESHTVSLSKDKAKVFITINVSEGKQYRIGSIRISGKYPVAEAEIREKITVKPGQIFSRVAVQESLNEVAARLAEDGFAFAKVNIIPDVDEKLDQVSLTFYLDPGKRIYVRHIIFSGNAKTQDEVLRREVTQMEGGYLSASDLKRSRTNLQRLGYISDAEVKTQVVYSDPDESGQHNLVDVGIKVKEAPAGRLTGGVSYSEVDGFGVNFGIHQSNFLGTGNSVGLTIDHSRVYSQYDVSYFDPYYTINGVGLGFSAYYNSTNLKKAQVGAHYALDNVGTSVNFVVPMSADDSLSFALGINQRYLNLRSNAVKISKELLAFKRDYGRRFLDGIVHLTWMHNSFDRAIFPHRGLGQSLGVLATVPGSDLMYAKLTMDHQWYHPLSRYFTFKTRLGLRYGHGNGKIKITHLITRMLVKGPGYAKDQRTHRGEPFN